MMVQITVHSSPMMIMNLDQDGIGTLLRDPEDPIEAGTEGY